MKEKKSICEYDFIRKMIEDWPRRIIKANLNQKMVAKMAGITPVALSLIIRFKTANPHKATMDAIERVFREHGV